MLIAQGLGEYASLSGVSSAFQSAYYQLEVLIAGLGAKEYFFIAVAGIVLFRLFSRVR